MIGTGLNVAGILFGGLCGVFLGHKMTQDLQDSLMKATGVCVLFLGMAGALEKMLVMTDGKLSAISSMPLIISMALGTLIGELINIEGYFERFGNWLKHVTKNEGDTGFVDAFVTASLTVCVGAMAIVGAVTEGITGDFSILSAKAILDLVIIMIMTVTKGKGAIFASVPIFFFQGTITLLAHVIKPFMTTAVLDQISLVGSVLIFCVGLNLIFGKLIRVANLLPAILVAMVLVALS